MQAEILSAGNHMKLIKYFFYLAMLLPFHAMGEGRCPPGFVPIGGQGAEGCAPIGGSSTSMPQPTGHWEKDGELLH